MARWGSFDPGGHSFNSFCKQALKGDMVQKVTAQAGAPLSKAVSPLAGVGAFPGLNFLACKMGMVG